MRLTIAEYIIANPISPTNTAMRKTRRLIGKITITKIIPQNISIPSEKSNFANSSNIHELIPEPAMKKFAESKIITNQASSEIGRRTNTNINGTGMASMPALLNNQAYGGTNFHEPGSAMVESSSFMFHSNSLPQCEHSNSPDVSASNFTSPSQCGQRIATMSIPN